MSKNLTVHDFPGITLPFKNQFGSDHGGPITLFNTFILASANLEEAFLAHWITDAQIMKAQDGMIQAQLHRAVGENNAFTNVAVWESLEKFRRAQANPDFQKSLSGYPPGTTMFPMLTTRVAVPGVCLA